MTLVMGVDYTEVADSSNNIFRGIVVPVGVASAGMVVLATMWGWWGPTLVEANPAKHRWPIIVPILLLIAAVLQLGDADLGGFDTQYLLYLAAGVLLVGFGEEMVTRGLLIVGLRARLGEIGVWLVSTLLFAGMHSLNFVFGQELGATAGQVGVTFLVGTALYILRRTGGYLILCMLLHAFWDFSSFAFNESGAEAGLGSLLALTTPFLALLAVWFVRDSLSESPAAATA